MEKKRVKPTALETADELEKSGVLSSARQQAAANARQGSNKNQVVTFRPLLRPPMAVLRIMDDDLASSEVVRLRAPETIVGRTDSDVVIPHDAGISGQHVKIVRELKDGEYYWQLIDLDSTNGTFVKCNSIRLQHGHQLLIGSQRYEFRMPKSQPSGSADAGAPKGTQGWQKLSHDNLSGMVPTLVHLASTGDGKVFPLAATEHWLGGDSSQCSVLLDEDAMVSPRHARIFRDDEEGWRIEDDGSVNGLWLRVDRTPVTTKCEFQIGEQRLRLKIP